MSQTRQLAAIMFTDIVGYTALMGEDEQKAFQILNKNRELQRPIIEKYGGRWIKELGDGVMAWFSTVSDAVYAAREIQLKCRQDYDFSLRIGIHLGEVVFEGEDVFGDAVNVASRLQAIAPVGGIFISESVYNDVINKADIHAKYVKTEKLKNVKGPLRIYEVIINNSDVPSQKKFTSTTGKIGKKPLQLLGLVLIGSIVILGLFYLLNKSKPFFANSSIESIAVLPFINESRVAEMEYLSDGMTETLINSLSKLQKLSVKARSSVFRYKGKDIDPQKLGEELSVQAILNGRVTQRGGNIILNLELVDVRSGNQIWGEQYNRKATDLVSLQTEIASDVSNKLIARLSGAEERKVTKSYTQNTEAYKLYLQGRYQWNRRRGESLKKAVEYFEKAIKIDPDYALAYASLAECYALFGEYGVQPAKISAPKGKEAALKALEIDPNLAEAFTALAYINTNYEWNFEEAEKNYQRAIQLNPQYATARQWYGEYLTQMTRFDEAAAQIRLALEFDPLSLIINQQMAELLMFQGKYDEAISTTKKTLEIDPNFPSAWGITGWAYEEKKMYDEAVAAYLKSDAAAGENKDVIASLENSYKNGGWQGYLEKILELKKKKLNEEIDQAGSMALQYALLGKKDEALKWLEVSYQNREDNMAWLKVESAWNFMRSDPRFQSLMKRVGFPQ